MFHCHSPSHPARHNRGDCFSVTAPHTLRAPAPLSSRGTVNSTREHCAGLLVMTCIAMQPLITSCCYEGMRMLHAVRPAQLRRPGDRETAAGTAGWNPRRPRGLALLGGSRGPARNNPRHTDPSRELNPNTPPPPSLELESTVDPSCGFSPLFFSFSAHSQRHCGQKRGLTADAFL